jgi:hypothetical protein
MAHGAKSIGIYLHPAVCSLPYAKTGMAAIIVATSLLKRVSLYAKKD